MDEKQTTRTSAVGVIRDAQRRGKIADPVRRVSPADSDWLVLAISWLITVLVFLAILGLIAKA